MMRRLGGFVCAGVLLLLVGSDIAKTGAESFRDRAREELRSGDPKQLEPAIDDFRAAIRIQEDVGAFSLAATDRLALSYTLSVRARRFEEARAALVFPFEVSETSRARADYFRALIATETGDLRAARSFSNSASEQFERLSLPMDRSDALMVLADTLVSVGRYAEAHATIGVAEAILPETLAPCKRAELKNNAGWIRLRAGIGGSEALFEEAAAIYQKACPQPAAQLNVAINLVFAKLDRGHVTEAAAVLPLAKPQQEQGFEREYAYYLVAALGAALAQGADEDALASANTLQSLAERSDSVDLLFEAASGKAEAFLIRGRYREALLAFSEAGKYLSAWTRRVPFGEGRGGFLMRHEHAARVEVGGLFAAGLVEEAANAARRSRRRRFEALTRIEQTSALFGEQRQRFSSAVDVYVKARESLAAQSNAAEWLPEQQRKPALEALVVERSRAAAAFDAVMMALGGMSLDNAPLPVPRPGEALFIVSPSREGWISFLLTDHSAAGHSFGVLEPDAPLHELSTHLLEPFRAELRASSRVTVLASGLARRIDVHRLPFEGSPLGFTRAVLYGTDLPSRPPRTISAPQAVVVGDPRLDLPGAMSEAVIVAQTLETEGFVVDRLFGGAATYGALFTRLERSVDVLFHYAGHSYFSGRDGVQSGLGLAFGTDMTLADIFSLKNSPPPRVVLSSCDGAKDEDEGLSIAEAFLLSGSEVVVASGRPLADASDKEIWKTVYGDKASLMQSPASLAMALSAWPSLRVMVR